MGKGSRNRQARVEGVEQTQRKKLTLSAIAVRVGVTLLCVAFACVLLVSLGRSSGFLQRQLGALKVGDQKVSVLEYNITNADVRSSTLYSLAQMGVDTTQPGILQMQLSETETVSDYIDNSTVSQLTEVYMLYSEAKAAGYELSEAGKRKIDDSIASLEETAAAQSMTLKSWIKQNYGKFVKEKDLRDVLSRQLLAQEYSTKLQNDFTFDEAKLTQHYEDNKDTYDRVRYRYFSFPYAKVTYTAPAEGEELEEGKPKSEEEAEQMTQENKDKAKANAEEMLSRLTDEQSMIDLAKEYAEEGSKEHYSDDDATLVEAGQIANTASVLAEWYGSDDRKRGDKDIVDTGAAYAVMYYIERYRDESPTQNVRHVLISKETAAEDATDEQKQAVDTANQEALAQAQQLLDQWKQGEATEESFATMAGVNSQDPGSSSNGGLYANVTEGTMVQPFNDWIFDSARKAGDTDIVETDYGYHIMYYVGEGLPVWQSLVDTDLRNEAYTAYREERQEKYPVKVNNFAMNVVG